MYSTSPTATVSGVDVGRRQQRRHAEVGVHGSLRVGRHNDDATTRRCPVSRRARSELHADSAAVVAEHPAELVVADLADVRRGATERRDTAHRVGRRPATHLDGTTERLVQVQRPISVDQGHRPLHELVLSDERVVRVSDDIDQGVADSHHVVLNARHVGAGYWPRPLRVRSLGERQPLPPSAHRCSELLSPRSRAGSRWLHHSTAPCRST